MQDKNTLPEGWGEQIDSDTSPWGQDEEKSESRIHTAPEKKNVNRNQKSSSLTRKTSHALQRDQRNLIQYSIIAILTMIIIAGSIIFILYLKKQQENQSTLLQTNTETQLIQTEASEAITEEQTEPPTQAATEPETTEVSTILVTENHTSSVTESEQLKSIGYGTPNSDDGFLNLRSSPKLTDNIVTEISNGEKISLYDCGNSEWYYVKYNGYEGYVKKNYVTDWKESVHVSMICYTQPQKKMLRD